MEGLSIGRGAGPAPTGALELKKLTVQMRMLSLFGGRLVFPLIWAEAPRGDLVLDQTGSLPRGGPGRLPRIDHLVISHGFLRVIAPAYRLGFAGSINSDESRAGRGPNITVVDGGLRIAGSARTDPVPLVDAPHVLVRLRLLDLLDGRLDLSLLEADRPRVHLVRDASGRANWYFGPGGSARPLRSPPIGRLILTAGAIDYQDARARLDFSGVATTDETVTTVGRGAFTLRGRGKKAGRAFSAQVGGGPIVNIDPGRPYPIAVQLRSGGSSLVFDGAFAHPFDLSKVSGRGRIKGSDLSELYQFTGVALPSSPPYDLSAAVLRDAGRFQFDELKGRMGNSDLAGRLVVVERRGRPILSGDLKSRRLDLTDLAAVVGGVPAHAAGHAISPTQKLTMEQLKAEHRILPDAHLDVSRIRTTDATLSYRADSVEAGSLPVTRLSLRVVLERGRLRVDPLRMDLPQGSLAASVHLDATGSTPRESIEARLSNARLETLVGRGQAHVPIEGGVFARLQLAGRGDSVRAAAASANGRIVMVISNGAIRQAFAELLGIDATKGLFLLLTKDQSKATIRCAVADFEAVDGVMTARELVVDTGVVLARGRGQIDLRRESLDLRLDGKPKKFRLVRIGAPITLTGYLAEPRVGIDMGKAAGQIALSGILGAVVAPLSSILPFVNPGLAHDADCGALETEAAE